MQEDLGLKDPEILHAIEVHTVGDAAMSDLAKVLYVADYIEEGRDFPGVIEARAIADYSLNMAVAFETMRLIDYLAELRVKFTPKVSKHITHLSNILKIIIKIENRNKMNSKQLLETVVKAADDKKL